MPLKRTQFTETPERVVVVGAGAAGIAASIAAARSGAKVALLEQASDVGGIVVRGLIHTIGGLHDAKGQFLNQGLPVELAERLVKADAFTRPRKIGRVWVLNASPAVYSSVVQTWLKEENITLYPGTSAIRPLVEGRRITAVELHSQGTRQTLATSALIDCTGEASVIGSLGPDHILADGIGASAGWIVCLRGVKVQELVFPKNVVVQRRVQSATAAGALPGECARVWIDTGVYDDEVFLKWSVPVQPNQSVAQLQSEHTTRFREALDKLVPFLRETSAFASAAVAQVGQISIRAGNRCKGEYILTGDDLRKLRKFDDAACRCAWPIEYWNPEKGVQMQYLDSDGSYDIPLRSLKAAGFDNLWAAGKCFSADHEAQASARVSGCCWAMGEAAGRAASRSPISQNPP